MVMTNAEDRGFLGSQIPEIRRRLQLILQDLTKNAAVVAREQALELVCNAIEAIPVPVLNKVLAQTVRRTFGGQQTSGDPNVEGLMVLLQSMKESDEGFDRGMADLGLNLGEIAADVAAVREHLVMQTQGNLRLVNPSVDLGWPAGVNRISALLANVGGGSIVVNELFLEVEGWDPETQVDYTVPAAPQFVLHLQAELTVQQATYPLLELNGLGPRIFNERGAGAERLDVDLTSVENARYQVRLRVPYINVVTGEPGVMYHPSQGDPPLLLPFVYAPGWRNIAASNVLERKRIIVDLERTLVGVRDLLEEMQRLPDQQWALAHAKAESLGLKPYVLREPSISYFLTRFVLAFTSLAVLEGQQKALNTILGIITAFPLDARWIQDPPAALETFVREIGTLTNNPDLLDDIRSLVSGEGDTEMREGIRRWILAGVRLFSVRGR